MDPERSTHCAAGEVVYIRTAAGTRELQSPSGRVPEQALALLARFTGYTGLHVLRALSADEPDIASRARQLLSLDLIEQVEQAPVRSFAKPASA